MSRLLGRRGLVVLLAAVTVLSGSLIAASLVASRDTSAPASPVRPSSFAGIPQAGAVLGDPAAK